MNADLIEYREFLKLHEAEDYHAALAHLQSVYPARQVLHYWNACDMMRPYRAHLTRILRKVRETMDPVEFFDAKTRAWFDAQPDPLPVFRGCEAGHEGRLVIGLPRDELI